MQSVIPCFICKSTDFKKVHQKDRWRYLQCRKCGLVSIDPRPTTQGILNNYETYLPVLHREIKQWEAMMKPVIDKSRRLIESRLKSKPGKLLDIGCGFGFFLREMKSRGWEVSGIEISKNGRNYARDTYDITIHSQQLEALHLPADGFDAVTLFYVIEHLLDPAALLKEVKRILKPGGMIMLRWPHTTPIVKFLGPLAKRLDLYHTPYHIYDFSRGTVEKVLREGGFNKIETVVGGYTLSRKKFSRWPSIFFGNIGEILFRLSGKRFLFPGISKTTIAFKREEKDK